MPLDVDGAVEAITTAPHRVVLLGVYAGLSGAVGVYLGHKTGQAFFGESSYDVAARQMREAADDGAVTTDEVLRIAMLLPWNRVPTRQFLVEAVATTAGLGLGTILLSTVMEDTRV